MLWLTLTRTDIVADVVLLQQHMVAPIVRNLKEANVALRRAKATAVFNGLHFRRLAGPLRCLSITDASHVSKATVHAQEAKLVLLTEDKVDLRGADQWLSASTVHKLEGFAHPLYTGARKATRVSHSTSHGEALGVLGGLQIAQLVVNRWTEPYCEVLFGITVPRPLDLLKIQNEHRVLIPIDCLTDCMDVWELICSARGLANDTSQRVVILGLREYRQLGIVRALMHCPTHCMIADGLTKVGRFPQLLLHSTSGMLRFEIGDKFFRLSVSPQLKIAEASSADLSGAAADKD